MSVESLYIDSDNLVTLDALYDNAAAAYVNDATVTVTLTDRAGNEVSGETWPVTLNYVAGSDGKYRGTLSDTLSITAYSQYTAKVIADGGPGSKATWYVPVRAIRNNG